MNHHHRIFLLSPANLAGIRAGYVLKDGATSDLALRLCTDGVPLGELFAFISGLYFRGKLAYANAFCAPPSNTPGAYVITANAGLICPDTIVTRVQLREMSGTDIDAADLRYRAPLVRACRQLIDRIADACDVVLLGSIATPKYVDPLLEVFGERLLFPSDFTGRGDMSRGALMLRAVEARKELAYAPVFNAIRHGQRPPKLAPPRTRGNAKGSLTPAVAE